MAAIISTRNNESQPEIFPPEIILSDNGLLQCGMGKKPQPEPREIYLGQWLKFFGVKQQKAAEIAGCGQSYISNMSSGRRHNVNALYLLALSEHLGVMVNDFFRPLSAKTQVSQLRGFSAQAQAAILNHQRRKS